MDIQRRSFHGTKPRQRRYLRVVLIAVIATVVAIGWYRHALTAPDPGATGRVPFVITEGESFSGVVGDLKENGLIRSTWAFSFHARRAELDRKIRAGRYVLRPSADADGILAEITGGSTGETVVTVPEGYTVADIDRLMAAKGLAATGAIIECSKSCAFAGFDFLPPRGGPGGRAEGYLFPDTYFVAADGGDPEAFLSRLLSTFRSKVVDALAPDVAASGKSLHEIVTMASLVEEEAAGDDERAPIAGILWKRLDSGITLGVDASVRYAVDKPTEPLTKADLEIDSPYNLRARGGLPPGPIANPGLASIEAALHPEQTPYFYYLHGTDGSIHYAATNDEHNANRAKYLR